MEGLNVARKCAMAEVGVGKEPQSPTGNQNVNIVVGYRGYLSTPNTARKWRVGGREIREVIKKNRHY